MIDKIIGWMNINHLCLLILLCVIFVAVFTMAIIGEKEDPIEIVEPVQDKEPFIFIDDDSGFLNSEDIMASFEKFQDKYWIRIDRYGYDNFHEFSVDTKIEAVSILKGLSK